ncbi:sulfatase-like hydrolase/transferase [bacterium]|nr:sulfatase-like hydrolase/transferase [bacterium]
MDQRPNIILITTDHLRRDALGCYGNSRIKTPNIDKLARNGAMFTNAYAVCPLCMPSRNSIVTGFYPHQHGICGNKGQPIRLEDRRQTFAKLLQNSGYQTAIIGKHHFYDFWEERRDYREIEDELKDYGFDKVIQVVDLSENLHNECDFTGYLRGKGLLEEYRKEASRIRVGKLEMNPDDTVDGFVGNRSVEHLREREIDKPFFLWASFLGPHPPYRAPGEYGEMYSPENMPDPMLMENPLRLEHAHNCYAQYYGMVSFIDHHVGRIISVLDERGILDNTIIIFTSDHGDMLGERELWDKRWFYEPSVGIPLIALGPGFPSGGSGMGSGGMKSRILCENTDIYATILEAAGIHIPKRRGVPRPGKPLQKMLNGNSDYLRSAVFSEMGRWFMIRDARWKLTYDPEQGGVQMLFNLVTDPNETENLCGKPEYRGIEHELVSKLLNWLIRTSAYTQYKEHQRIKRVIAG